DAAPSDDPRSGSAQSGGGSRSETCSCDDGDLESLPVADDNDDRAGEPTISMAASAGSAEVLQQEGGGDGGDESGSTYGSVEGMEATADLENDVKGGSGGQNTNL
ncbi:unnamed protein product, partial [Ectocarpus sp. 12 AP-2014]